LTVKLYETSETLRRAEIAYYESRKLLAAEQMPAFFEERAKPER
jgi:hypothetical protein